MAALYPPDKVRQEARGETSMYWNWRAGRLVSRCGIDQQYRQLLHKALVSIDDGNLEELIWVNSIKAVPGQSAHRDRNSAASSTPVAPPPTILTLKLPGGSFGEP
jgi:hypothetical protein